MPTFWSSFSGFSLASADALEIAESAAETLQRLGKTQRLDEWIQVIAEIQQILKTGQPR
jgi:hypothetical protein